MLDIKVKSVLKRFLNDKAGSVSLSIGLAAVPLFLAAGVAIDYSRAVSAKHSLQQIADAAAISAAASTTATSEQRKQMALDFVSAKTAAMGDVEIETPTVNISPNTVDVILRGKVEGQIVNVGLTTGGGEAALGGAVDSNAAIAIGAKSKASFARDSYKCLLSLHATSYEAVRFYGNSDFTAEVCTVHANSDNNIAMRTAGSAYAEAEDFCARGGWAGSGFEPDPTGGCKFESDPYASLALPTVSSTCLATDFKVKKLDGDQALAPGVYCGGINLQTFAKATLAPGTYIIKDGKLDLAAHSELIAEDVTFYLVGDSSIEVASGSKVSIVAPTAADVAANGGGLAGMAIIQKADSSPGVTNVVSSGGDVNIVGAYYTPKQNLQVWANGDMNLSSPYFPIVVDKFEMSGTATLYVKLDWAAAGYAEPVTLKTNRYVYLSQ